MEKNFFVHKDIACKRLRSVGLTQQQALSILDTVNKWKHNNGLDWTITRLKDLKVAYIHKLAGYENPFSDVSTWLACGNGYPKGPFKCIFSELGKKPQKAISALMVYTEATLKDVSPNQWKKFFNGVNSPEPDRSSYEKVESFILNAMDEYKLSNMLTKAYDKSRYDNIERWTEREVRSPTFKWTYENGEYSKVYVTMNNGIDALKTSLDHPLAEFLLTNGDFRHSPYKHLTALKQEIWKSKDENLRALKHIATMRGSNDEDFDPIVGNIGFIQEPGAKLRSVSNPLPVFQLLSSKLGNTLYGALKRFSRDFTHNQEDAATKLQEFWKQNPEVVIESIDLSSATDTFPLEIQKKILLKLGIPQFEIDLFNEISRSSWKLPEQAKQFTKETTIKWTVGQPLGLYTSFAAFAVCHNIVAHCAMLSSDKLGLNEGKKFFAILGDDIMMDQESAQLMRKIYNSLGCKISESKSIKSNQLAEFGGRLISHNRIFIQPKWKNISDRSFIDLAKNLGPKSRGLFTYQQRKILDILDPITKDMHPWGLGWNSKALPYSKRLEYFNSIEDRLVVEKLTAKTSHIAHELNDIKLEMQLLTEFPIHINRSEPRDISSMEERILANANIHRIHVSDEVSQPKSFTSDPTVVKKTSDPRGESTLNVAQQKFKGVKPLDNVDEQKDVHPSPDVVDKSTDPHVEHVHDEEENSITDFNF